MTHATLCDVFAAIESRARPDLFLVKKGGAWIPVSGTDFASQVKALASYLILAGAAPGDRVAIFSENRLEWQLAAFAIQIAGCVDVPVYATSSSEQIRHVLSDSGAKAAFVSTPALLAKLLDAAPESFEGVIAFDPPGSAVAAETVAPVTADAVVPPATDASGAAPRPARVVVTLSDALAEGARHQIAHPRALGARMRAVGPGDLSSLVYTSGTTGEPKGVMLTQSNICSNLEACRRLVPIVETDVALAFLPLSHVFERMAEYIYLAAGGGIAYAESMESIPANLLEIRPTVICAVPRVLEKVHARVLANVESQPAIKRRLFAWALRTGQARSQRLLTGGAVPAMLAARFALADRLVLSKIRERLGGRVRLLVSGGAPLARELAEFFLATDVTVLEGYGLTETSPVIALNTPGRIRPGTVGPVIPGIEVRIAPDGEILVRGPNVMKGYYRNEEATREILRDGWLATGDIGSFDSDGFLIITDRKKDLIVTSGGKNVAPQPIESALKESRYVSNAVLFGDHRKFIAALIVPDFGTLRGALVAGEADAREAIPPSELMARPEVSALIQAEVDRVNARLASYEQVRKFALLERDLTAEAGELTPTMKVRRRTVAVTRKAEIDALYED